MAADQIHGTLPSLSPWIFLLIISTYGKKQTQQWVFWNKIELKDLKLQSQLLLLKIQHFAYTLLRIYMVSGTRKLVPECWQMQECLMVEIFFCFFSSIVINQKDVFYRFSHDTFPVFFFLCGLLAGMFPCCKSNINRFFLIPVGGLYIPAYTLKLCWNSNRPREVE